MSSNTRSFLAQVSRQESRACFHRLNITFPSSQEDLNPTEIFKYHSFFKCAMPKSDSWPGVISKEPMSGMDSAGSCDSMISINSTFSDDSLEHLSAEEKACLMFLEETIDSLDVEDDSGLSNDEPDRPSYITAGKMTQHPSIHHNKLEAHGDPNKVLGKDHRPSQRYLVPTPLLVATGNAKMDTRPGELSPKAKPAVFIDSPDGLRSTPDHHQTALAALQRAGSSKVAPAKPSIEPSREEADLPPSFIPEPPTRARKSESKHSPPKSLDTKNHKGVTPEMLLGWIPPPSDFMDEPEKKRDPQHSQMNLSVVDGPPEWTPEIPKIKRHSYGGSVKPEVIKPQSIEKSRASLSKNDIENLRQKALMKKTPLTPVMIAQHSAADYPRTPSPSSEHPPSEPKIPPPVAPKQKLPSNIILKSHKESGAANPLLSPTDRTLMDQQKVHKEALRKLGLLKSDEVDSRPVSTAQSPSFKSKDLSPVSPRSPPVYPTSPTVEPLQDRSRSSTLGDIHLRTDSTKHRDMLETALQKPPARPYEIKSASLGRTGVGLNSVVVGPRTQASNSDVTNVELSPGQLRKSRARPHSSGSVKDVDIDHLANKSTKSLHAASALPTQPAGDAQKMPRFNGISVVISPHGKNGENRREALKKLGLLKDGNSH
ncbi:specifically androgen-regulated gene protein [Misgurnus anguillicaudatus]|uniref:specifically androgen-regulated gene protein n=1 Tax=Misgurnus anguillicaudatus TaxID=75329 RepID=UPI003CCFAC2C